MADGQIGHRSFWWHGARGTGHGLDQPFSRSMLAQPGAVWQSGVWEGVGVPEAEAVDGGDVSNV